MPRRHHADNVALPRVEVIHWKDLDNSCEHVVFMDGVEIRAEVFTIDPSRSYTRSAWDMDTETQAGSASPSVARVLRDARNDVAKSNPYIMEENE